MAVPLYVSNSTSTGSEVATLTVPYPINETGSQGAAVYPPNSPPQSGESMWLAVVYRKENMTSIAAPTVSGWTAVITPSTGTGVHLGLYYKQGNGDTGAASIQWADEVMCGAIITLVDRSATVSPVDFTGTASTAPNAFGIHSISSQTTTENDVMALGIWYGPGNDSFWAQFGSDTGYFYDTAGEMQQVSVIGSDPTFTPPTGKTFGFPIGVVGIALSVNYELRAAQGGIGARIAISKYNTGGGPQADSGPVGLIAMVGIKPFTGPGRPTLTAPVTGETIALGRTYNLTWIASIDPNIAQSALTYNIDYTLNDGFTWVEIVANTSAGAITYPWNTTGLSATPQAKLRIRAHNGTEFSSYYTTGRFTLATDVAPNAPINMHGEQPDGTTVTLFDRTLTLLVKGTFSDLGDVMTGYQLDWGTDGITYGTASGTITSSVLSHSFPGATFSSGTVYFRARTKDTAGTFGPYTFFTLTAATPPAAPNITAPTAGSPPNAPFPTISWTSTGQVSYRITITSGGATSYAGAFVASSATSVTSPFAFLNDTEYTLTIVYKDSSGLTSPSDSETFTVSFLGPATPTIVVT
jgi:hypothetical protein